MEGCPHEANNANHRCGAADGNVVPANGWANGATGAADDIPANGWAIGSTGAAAD